MWCNKIHEHTNLFYSIAKDHELIFIDLTFFKQAADLLLLCNYPRFKFEVIAKEIL